MGVGLFKNIDDIRQMTGECAQVLFDGLFVANVCVHSFEDGKCTALVYRNHHARLGHQREEPDGFEGDSFAPGVWTGYNENVTVVVEIDVNRDDGFRVNQGVAGLAEVQDRTRMLNRALFLCNLVDTGEDFGAVLLEGDDLGCVGLHFNGIFGLSKREVELRKNLHVAVDVGTFVGDKIRKFGEDAPDFLFFLQLQFSHVVVLLDNGQRFDKECRARSPTGRERFPGPCPLYSERTGIT